MRILTFLFLSMVALVPQDAKAQITVSDNRFNIGLSCAEPIYGPNAADSLILSVRIRLIEDDRELFDSIKKLGAIKHTNQSLVMRKTSDGGQPLAFYEGGNGGSLEQSHTISETTEFSPGRFRAKFETLITPGTYAWNWIADGGTVTTESYTVMFFSPSSFHLPYEERAWSHSFDGSFEFSVGGHSALEDRLAGCKS